ncbi:MAG TPA: ribosomal RNA small subunit methyltransferase A [Candidatus Thalassarchaeaceae archaeon]|nr:MAG TPA: ribosomal RNA small subunit methyltransferase A [Candidatus Poseidoniales archaeon]HIH83864.1 ribosomal RNA small subunit methyltransferase A [Candidatus Thalassarchaeaceae archaeon]
MDDVDARLLIDLLLDRRRVDRDLGQHYLHDETALYSAIEMCAEVNQPLGPDSRVLEIGPGPGSLTLHLLSTAASVIGIEIEEEAINHLNRNFTQEIESGRLELIEGDALTVKWPDVTHIVANIPYQISSPLIDRIRNQPGAKSVTCVVLLLQQEFAHRLAMHGGPDSVGPLGLNTALDWDVNLGPVVPPHCFVPSPRVHSQLACLVPRKEALPANLNHRLHRLIVKHVFAQRRRKVRSMLRSNPKRISRIPGWYRERWSNAIDSVLEATEIDVESRPDLLSPEDWIHLTIEIEAFEPD